MEFLNSSETVHREQQRRHVADTAPTASSVKPAKPRELLYSRHINQDDHAKQADFNDGWKVIACRKLDDKSVLAIVSIERNLATFSIIQKVNKASSAASAKGAPDAAAAAAANVEGAVVAVAAAPSAELMGASSGATASSPGPAAAEKDLKVLLPMMRASRSPKISRNASFEKQMVFTSVAAMKDGKSGLGAGSFQGKLLVCGELLLLLLLLRFAVLDTGTQCQQRAVTILLLAQAASTGGSA